MHESINSDSLASPRHVHLQNHPRLTYAQSLPVSAVASRPRARPRSAPDVGENENDKGQTRRPQYSRSLSGQVKNYIKKSTFTFFGVDNENEDGNFQRWMERRKRMASKRYGQLKEQYQEPMSAGEVLDIRPEPQLVSPVIHDPVAHQWQESQRTTTYTTGAAPGTSQTWHRQVSFTPDITDGSTPSTTTSASFRWPVRPHRRKDSVVKLTWDGLSFLANSVARRRGRSRSQGRIRSRSFAPSSIVDDSVFVEDSVDASAVPASSVPPVVECSESLPDDVFFDKAPTSTASAPHRFPLSLQMSPLPSVGAPPTRGTITVEGPPGGWRQLSPPHPPLRDHDQPAIGLRRIWNRLLSRAFDNSDRRQYGMGLVGQFTRRSFRRDRITSDVRHQLDDIDDHRPYFTYWVTTVQILITIISLAVYGFGPVGFEQTQRSNLVLTVQLALQEVDYFEPQSFWIGPRAADLVHLGAKFAPCMRRDSNIFDAIERDRKKEKETACCIRNDNSGCVQATRDECSTTISTWQKWTNYKRGPGGRISGSVCGQDPDFCSDPPSISPYDWPDDITKWPICRQRIQQDYSRSIQDHHMACKLIAHPCCIGILGECRITTLDYCDFVKGFFHEEAFLCSQVSCLNDVCGMIKFHNPEAPDQIYRLWTSLFLHAGLLHLVLTVMVQYFLMRDLEKLAGPLRIGIIYIMSGIAGNLASAIFVPYRAEVGPAGSQFGLLACLFVEVIHSWHILKDPCAALLRLVGVVVVLVLLGLLPWIDNYSHVVGFLFGFLLSYALLPFVSFGKYDRRRKITLIWVCLLLVILLFIGLILLFYIFPIYKCEFCKYFNCIPLTRNFCANQDINITRGSL